MTPYRFDHLDEAAPTVSQRPPGVFLDFDGTLAPLESTPDATRIDPACRKALVRLTPRIE